MKNIHVLSTDKPSRLFELSGDLHLHNELGFDHKRSRNIYITSDEEIKEGDWVIVTNIANGLIFVKQHKGIAKALSSPRKKIILTTDQDLIKDGVQAIDDEFLEWFVQNPSCEEVGVEPLMAGFVDDEPSYYENMYDIIIRQQEEPKQETLEEIANKLSTKEAKDLDLFLKGIEWQKEKDKKMYSLDDLKEAFAMGRTNATIKDFNTKFEKE